MNINDNANNSNSSSKNIGTKKKAVGKRGRKSKHSKTSISMKKDDSNENVGSELMAGGGSFERSTFVVDGNRQVLGPPIPQMNEKGNERGTRRTRTISNALLPEPPAPPNNGNELLPPSIHLGMDLNHGLPLPPPPPPTSPSNQFEFGTLGSLDAHHFASNSDNDCDPTFGNARLGLFLRFLFVCLFSFVFV